MFMLGSHYILFGSFMQYPPPFIIPVRQCEIDTGRCEERGFKANP